MGAELSLVALRLLFASTPDALSRCLAVSGRAVQMDLAHRAGLTYPQRFTHGRRRLEACAKPHRTPPDLFAGPLRD